MSNYSHSCGPGWYRTPELTDFKLMENFRNQVPYYQRQRKPTMSNKLTIYTPPAPDKTQPPIETEVCLKLTKKLGRVLLEIIDPITGEHVSSGNLINIYPNGTYSVIPGAVFGSN